LIYYRVYDSIMATKEMKRRVRSYYDQGLIRQALDRVFDADEVDCMVEVIERGTRIKSKKWVWNDETQTGTYIG